MSERLRYDEEDGRAEVEGRLRIKGTRLVWHEGDFYVVKTPGHHYYGGQGRPEPYAPAMFEVYEEVFTEDERQGWAASEYVDGWIPVRRRMRFPVRA